MQVGAEGVRFAKIAIISRLVKAALEPRAMDLPYKLLAGRDKKSNFAITTMCVFNRNRIHASFQLITFSAICHYSAAIAPCGLGGGASDAALQRWR
ncbi:MAG: hypothetical protein K2I58_04505, partial [Candidatus Amulumruptor sp.]|nr:hypothetical protein [Candidatus Amulumruptor sp.]